MDSHLADSTHTMKEVSSTSVDFTAANRAHAQSGDALTDLFSPDDYTSNGRFDIEAMFDKFPLPRPQGKLVQRVPNTASDHNSSVYRNTYCRGSLIERVHPDLDNMVSAFNNAVETFGDRECLGTRLKHPDGTVDDFFTYDSYNTVAQRRRDIGAGLRTLVGGDIKEKFIVSLYSANRPEWVITFLACQGYNMVYTALYDTLGPTTSSYILNLTESPVIVCSREKIVGLINLKKSHNGGLPTLKFIVSMDPLDLNRDFGLIQLAETNGLKLLDFSQLETLGQLNPMELIVPGIDELYGISFTSGTTGNPKGVEITHRMSIGHLTFSLASVAMSLSKGSQLKTLSFLPLAHIYEVTNMAMQLFCGFTIAYAPDPSPLKLVENLIICKPNLMALVPRVYTKFEGALKEAMSNSFIGRQILSGIESKMKNGDENGLSRSIVLDNLALKGIAKKLGFTNCTLAISGSAPIGAETVSFLRNALGMGFAQGYGLTESTSGIAVSGPFDKEITCGAVAVSCEIRLRDIPEMNYLTHDKDGVEVDEPKGELLLRGPQIFKQYFKNEVATKESFDDEGWFKTGDVAKLDLKGRIHIIDRVKNFFKLAQGEYITPERIENTYLSACSFLTQMYVHGDSFKTFLVAIVGVDPEALKTHLCHSRELHHLSKWKTHELLEKVNSSPDVKRQILLEMNKKVQHEGLHGFEKLHNIRLMVEPLKISDETITPTLKIKRNVAFKFFKREFEELYGEGSLLKNKL